MPRIIGVEIPGKKRIEFALQYIYGIGPAKAKEIITKLDIPADLRAESLTQEQIGAIVNLLQHEMVVEGDLRRMLANDIRRLMSIGSYRGLRHKKKLPVRGQRTKTNARTRKGRKMTVGAIRDKTQRRLAASN